MTCNIVNYMTWIKLFFDVFRFINISDYFGKFYLYKFILL